jgi:phage gp45-like
MNIITFVRNMIKRGTVSRQTADSGQFAAAQVKWASDKVGNVEVIHSYGFSSYAPVGSLALMFSVMGQESNRAAIINDPKIRFKDLKPGEVAVGNFLTRSRVKFLENGDIEIFAANDQNITITGDSNLTVGGNTTITTTGNTVIDTTGNTTINSDGNVSSTIGGTLTANVTGNTSITSPVLTLTGELRVTGEITGYYGTGSSMSFTNLWTKYNAHTHTSATAGSPTSATLSPNTLP